MLEYSVANKITCEKMTENNINDHIYIFPVNFFNKVEN